jgi:hypothetical protein
MHFANFTVHMLYPTVQGLCSAGALHLRNSTVQAKCNAGTIMFYHLPEFIAI